MVQTLPRTPMQSTETPPNLLRKAQSGNADAIAQLLSRAFAHHGMSVYGSVNGDQLDLRLEGTRLPDQQEVIPLIQRGLMRLGFARIRTVHLQAQLIDDVSSAGNGWTYQFQIVESLNTPLEPRPDTESLVRVHVGDRNNANSLDIGSYHIQATGHGHIIHARSEPSSQLKRRPKSALATAYRPLHPLLDRQPETQDALSALTTGNPVEFYGGHGLGKSSLLQHLAHNPFTRRQFKDGISYHHAASQPIEDSVQDLFDSFYESESLIHTKPTPAQLLDAWRDVNALAIFDDVPANSNPILTNLSIALLISSDEHHLRNAGQSIPMRGLPLQEAIALVEQRLGRSFENEAERQDAETICRVLKGHPLHILQNIGCLQDSARQGGHGDVPTTLRQLAEQLQSGLPSEAVTIRAATMLPELERRVLAVLAVFEQISIDTEYLKPLTGASNLDLTIQILLERGLICGEGDCYRIASNVLPYFQQIWDLTPWIERASAYFTTLIQQHEGAIAPLLKAHAPLWRMTQLASHDGHWETVLHFSQSLDHPLMLGKRWGRWRQMWELGLSAARSMGDGAAEALAFHQLGSRALCLGDLFTAHTYLTEAVQRRIALRDEIGAAVSQHNLNLLFSPDAGHGAVAPRSQIDSPVTIVQPQTALSAPSQGSLNQTESIQPGIKETLSPASQQVTQNGAIAPAQSAIQPTAPAPVTKAVTPDAAPAATTELVAQAQSTLKQPASTATSPPKVYSQATEARSFPMGWIAVSAIAALFGGVGAYLALTWNRAPFSVTPNSVVFPPQLLSVESGARQLTITNTGSESLDLSSIALSGGDRFDFSISENCTQEPLRPEDTCTIGLSFLPGESTARSTRLRIADRTGEHVRFVQVRGVGEVAQVSVTPDGLAFDPILTGREQDPTQSITIMNDSAVTFSMGEAFIAGERTDSFAIARDGCVGQSLDPNDTCTVDVAFTPPGGGVFEANFAIRDATEEYTWLSPLIGTGQLSAPTISPAGLPFDREVIGRLATDVVTITNTAASPLEINSITITGDTANFSIRGNTCTRNPIQPGESCSVTVGFNPQSERNYSANLVISDNAVNSPRSIVLSGRGTRVSAPVITPNPLMFGEQEIGDLRQEALTITNRGSQSIQVQDILIPDNGDFDIVNESCTNNPLAAGGTCTVTVGFTPQDSGDRSAVITVRDTATGSPRTVEVRGTGVAVPSPQIPSPQILSVEVTPEEVPPGERSRICYRVANVERLFLRDGEGQVISLDSTSGCVSITPNQTTTYTLVAEGQNGQSVNRQVQVRVSAPDTTPPPVPAPVAPAGNEYVLCPSTPNVNLDWNPVNDDSEPISYMTMLQRGSSASDGQETVSAWTGVTQQSTTATELNITPYLERGRVSYRWRVSARDAAGNASGPSNWFYFRTCE